MDWGRFILTREKLFLALTYVLLFPWFFPLNIACFAYPCQQFVISSFGFMSFLTPSGFGRPFVFLLIAVFVSYLMSSWTLSGHSEMKMPAWKKGAVLGGAWTVISLAPISYLNPFTGGIDGAGLILFLPNLLVGFLNHHFFTFNPEMEAYMLSLSFAVGLLVVSLVGAGLGHLIEKEFKPASNRSPPRP